MRYVLLTVDTEALPKRASGDHVRRLIWGEHPGGTAGIREMSAIGAEFGAKHVFFVDFCGAHDRFDEMCEVVTWLHAAGEDIQLHTHPEVLPASFWQEHGFAPKPSLMNQYGNDARSELVIGYFSNILENLTGRKVLAHRAGSFRWNATTIRALGKREIRFSFNNSMRAFRAGRCAFGEATNAPYAWSNGVIEVPLTERLLPVRPGEEERWVNLSFPESAHLRFESLLVPAEENVPDAKASVSVMLMHSWSFLRWDEEGHAAYVGDQIMDDYRKLLSWVTKNFDVITSEDLVDLVGAGKIAPAQLVDLGLIKPPPLPTPPRASKGRA